MAETTGRGEASGAARQARRPRREAGGVRPDRQSMPGTPHCRTGKVTQITARYAGLDYSCAFLSASFLWWVRFEELSPWWPSLASFSSKALMAASF